MRKILPVVAALAALFMFHAAAQPEAPSLDAAFDGLKAYTIGGDFSACQRIINEVTAAKADPVAQAAIAARLAGAIKGANYDTQKFLCFWLYTVGTEKEAPSLAPLLQEEKTAAIARYALDAMPGAGVDRVLLDALNSAKPAIQAGLLDSLAKRGNPGHVAIIAPYLKEKNIVLARAAANALGQIGTPEALSVLEGALSTKNAKLRPAIVDAALRAARSCATAGSSTQGSAVFERLLSRVEDKQVRIAAFCGIVETSEPATAGARLVQALSGNDPLLLAPALGLARRVSGNEATVALAVGLDNIPLERQAAVLAALADRGDAAAYGNVLHLAESPEASVRLAALAAVGVLGDASAVQLLLPHLSAATDEEKAAARAALVVLKGAAVDGLLVGALAAADAATKMALMGVLAGRGASVATDALLGLAVDPDPALRGEACKSLGALAPVDRLPALLALIKSKEPSDREAVENALSAAVRRFGPESGALAVINEGFKKQWHAEQRALLLRVLGRSGDPAALDTLRKALKAWKTPVRHAAIEALGNWPDTAPLADLRALAAKRKPKDRAVVLEGMLKLLKLAAKQPAPDIVSMYREALALAVTPDEIRKVLSGLGEVKDPAVVDLIRPYLETGECQEEAAAAADKVLRKFYKLSASQNSGEAGKAADGVIESRWSTNAPQQPGQWLQVDLGARIRVGGVFLECGYSPGDYPRGYEVYVSDDPANPGQPAAAGAGDGAATRVKFPPVEGRYVRIVQTGVENSLFWSVHEMRVMVK